MSRQVKFLLQGDRAQVSASSCWPQAGPCLGATAAWGRHSHSRPAASVLPLLGFQGEGDDASSQGC